MHLLRCAIPIEAPTGILTRPVPESSCGGPQALQQQRQQHQTLVATGVGQLVTLLGADAHNGMDLVNPLEVFGTPDGGSELVPLSYAMDALRAPVWDAFSGSVFVLFGNAIVRLDAGLGGVAPVVGHFQEAGSRDGPGAAARFHDPSLLVSDGLGSLYVADAGRIRRVQLPTAWAAAAAAAEAPSRQSPEPITGAAGATCGDGDAGNGYCLSLTPISSPTRDGGDARPRPAEALVSTLPLEPFCEVCGLAFCGEGSSAYGGGRSGGGGGGGSGEGGARTADAGGGRSSVAGGGAAAAAGSLIFATSTAVYRLPLDWVGNAAAAAAAGGSAVTTPAKSPARSAAISSPAASSPAASALVVVAAAAAGAVISPQLLAGREEDRGDVDGPGPDARFRCITGLTLDADGAAYVVDYGVGDDSSAVRRVAPDGGGGGFAMVTTLAVGLKNRLARPAVLPNGYLAICDPWSDALQLLDLGLAAPPPCGAAPGGVAAAVPYVAAPLRGLAADLGALLDRQPDDTADLTLVVGGRTFAVHRCILAARCDYFRRRLAGGFAESAAAAATAAARSPLHPPLSPPPPSPPQTQSPPPPPFLPLPPRPPQPQLQPSSTFQQQPHPQRSPQPQTPQPTPQQPSPPRQRTPHQSPHQHTPPTPQQSSQQHTPQTPQSPQTPQQQQHPAPQPQQVLNLPDADPDAFALLLRFLYTGTPAAAAAATDAAAIPRELAPAVAELADRLLLPELSAAAQARVLADVTAESVVGAMLWAEARGPGFAALLAALKGWYLDHHEDVVARAPGSVKRLMMERCELMMELHFNYNKRMRAGG